MTRNTRAESQAEVLAILLLYDCVSDSVNSLSSADQARLAIQTNINLAHFRFEGFDRADGTKEHHYAILQSWIEGGLYPDYRQRSLNTGSPHTLRGYRAMLALGVAPASASSLSWNHLLDLLRLHRQHSDNPLLLAGKSPFR